MDKTIASFKTYYRLTKPGIIYGNALTAIGGFLLASKGHIHFWLLIATLAGISLVIASACVFNNYIDRDIDKLMARTKKRALVNGTINSRNALVFAAVLGMLGFFILIKHTNKLTAIIGLIGYTDYIVLYGWAKRNSVYGTIVGSISGSMPIVAGYCAVSNRFDTGALLLFAILALWQMPHFYAIAMYRYADYKNAKIPVWPVKKGMHSTKIQIMLFIAAFIAANSLLTIRHYTGYTFLIIMSLLGLTWFWKGLAGFMASPIRNLHASTQPFLAKTVSSSVDVPMGKSPSPETLLTQKSSGHNRPSHAWERPAVDDKKWARKMFFFSLIIILALSIMLSLNHFLP